MVETALDLASRGFSVTANVAGSDPPHKRMSVLAKGDVDLVFRPRQYSLWERALFNFQSRGKPTMVREVEKQIASRSPSLVCLSDGLALPQVELLEMCIAMGVPFVTIGQANSEFYWIADDVAARFRAAVPAALRCFSYRRQIFAFGGETGRM